MTSSMPLSELTALYVLGGIPLYDAHTGQPLDTSNGSLRVGRGALAQASRGALAGLEPPRFCPLCGRRMKVQVNPMGWTAECSRHGDMDSSIVMDV